MRHGLRDRKLIQLLLVTGGLAVHVACECDERVFNVPISDELYEQLLAADGSLNCDSLCGIAPTDTGSSTPYDQSTSYGTGSTGTDPWQDWTARCRLVKVDWQQSAVACNLSESCSIGRRPLGLQPHPTTARTLGMHFAEICRLEAASVVAFRRLAEELARHGAPVALQQAAERSARDEARHAVLTARLARRHGADPVAPVVDDVDDRPLVQLAIHNAVEGCVGEAFGAVQAAHAAEHATDPEIARTMRSIARDEAEHAALSFAIADWIRPRLDEAERHQLDQALTEAVARLRRSRAVPLAQEDRQRAGLPDEAERGRWLDQLDSALWSAEA
ncbi:MAG: ferritin-like domain-containing protein [Myxococcales bacterium]|nr:ferritin-like domain-containing protein [Myxococcales bacterium]